MCVEEVEDLGQECSTSNLVGTKAKEEEKKKKITKMFNIMPKWLFKVKYSF